MISLDKARIVKYKKDNHIFEVFVDPELAYDIREGYKKYDDVYLDLFPVETIFKDAKKGDKASKELLVQLFNTDDFFTIAKEILLKGRLDLTTEQRRKILENRKKELINYIVRNSINPMNNLPHTPLRVESAIEKARLDIDVHKSLEKQLDYLIAKLKPFLPMTFQKIKYRIHVPIAVAGKISGFLSKYDILERKWQNEFTALVAVPIGLKDEFLKKLSGISQGKARIEIVE